MEVGDLEETLRVLNSCISRVPWRLSSSSKQKLERDILSLCTGLRAVILVDYGGKMPELQDHLCALFHLIHKESVLLVSLRVMIITDMVYMIHVKGLAELASSSLSLEHQILFVDLEQDPPKMLLLADQNIATAEIMSIIKLFSSLFPVDTNMDILPLMPPSTLLTKVTESSDIKDVDQARNTEHKYEIIDLTNILDDSQITVVTVNGWLLGYPVVYLFRKDNASDAVYNLSTKSIRVYKIVVSRNQTYSSQTCEEVLMSFSVPYDLSLGQEKERWAENFLTCMLAKFERCDRVWAHMRLEVDEMFNLAVVL